ncbi:MAG: hypothetical protein ACE5HO_17360 [bacterium]
MAEIKPDKPAPEGFGAQLKPFRVRRKRLATFCLFIVITTIIFGLLVYGVFSPLLTMGRNSSGRRWIVQYVYAERTLSRDIYPHRDCCENRCSLLIYVQDKYP